VIRIALPYVFNYSANIEPLRNIFEQETDLLSIYGTLLQAQNAIETFNSSMYSIYLFSSRPAADALLSHLRQITTESISENITQYEIWQIKYVYNDYRIAFNAELATLNTYFVTHKLPFDVRALLEVGESLFPIELANKVPEAVTDAREAGKCLAYEAPTAAGFHLFRVLESVLRRYYANVTGGAAAPKQRNIAVYINALRQAKKGDERILSVVKQISDLHRNPLSHPEAILSTDEAIAAAGIVRSAVTLMLAVLPTPLTTTTSPSPVSTGLPGMT
jgi:hypothetical protein